MKRKEEEKENHQALCGIFLPDDVVALDYFFFISFCMW